MYQLVYDRWGSLHEHHVSGSAPVLPDLPAPPPAPDAEWDDAPDANADPSPSVEPITLPPPNAWAAPHPDVVAVWTEVIRQSWWNDPDSVNIGAAAYSAAQAAIALGTPGKPFNPPASLAIEAFSYVATLVLSPEPDKTDDRQAAAAAVFAVFVATTAISPALGFIGDLGQLAPSAIAVSTAYMTMAWVLNRSWFTTRYDPAPAVDKDEPRIGQLGIALKTFSRTAGTKAFKSAFPGHVARANVIEDPAAYRSYALVSACLVRTVLTTLGAALSWDMIPSLTFGSLPEDEDEIGHAYISWVYGIDDRAGSSPTTAAHMAAASAACIACWLHGIWNNWTLDPENWGG